jgi:3-phenylpropionate/trans-cinnamate dioxygenase ferredoxin subunit
LPKTDTADGAKHVVCSVDELPPGERKIITIGKRSIGVFNVNGTYRAFRNLCPHHGAQICLGDVSKMMAPSEPHTYVLSEDRLVLRCPWHGYECDANTGEAVVADQLRVKVYPVTVEDGQVVLHD